MALLLPPESVVPLLDEFFARHLPITRYLNMRCHEYTGDCFSLAIDLQPSINDKLTAFGGSLYCLCVMNCWGMAYLQCRQRGINPNMVVSHAEIDYMAPVDDNIIIATCQAPAAVNWELFANASNAMGETNNSDIPVEGKIPRARTALRSSVFCNGREAVRFSGEYAVIGLAE